MKRKEKVGKHEHESNISGDNIKKVRKNMHYSQDDVAAKLQLEGLSVTASTISKIESKDRSVTDKELLAFSKVLDTSAQDLISGGTENLPE